MASTQSLAHYFNQLIGNSKNASDPIFAHFVHTPPAKFDGISYRQFLGLIQLLGDMLSKELPSGSQRCLIFMQSSLQWDAVDRALMALGHTTIGLEPFATPELLNHVLELVKPDIVFVDSTERISLLNRSPYSFKKYYQLNNNYFKDISTNTEIPFSTPPLADPSGFRFSELPSTHPATIILTSGTTSQKKAVPYDHSQFLQCIETLAATYGPVREGDRILSWLPLANLFQRVLNATSLHLRVPIYYLPRPQDITHALPVVAPTVFIAVPRFYTKVHQKITELTGRLPKKAQRKFFIRFIARKGLRRVFGKNVRILISGSAPCPPETLRFFKEYFHPIHEAYGVTESIIPLAANTPAIHRLGSVGQILSPNEVLLSESGEILLKSPGLSRLIELDRDGYYHTGDIGHFDEDGFLYLDGRQNEIFKTSSGWKINPKDLEFLLTRIPGVDYALVGGHGRDAIFALINPTPGISLSFEDTIKEVKALNRKFPYYSRIRHLICVTRPFEIEKELTTNLKLRRGFIEHKYASLFSRLYDKNAESGVHSQIPHSDDVWTTRMF